MIGSRGLPAHVGGVEHVVEDLARELTLRGHEVLVYGRRHYVAAAGPPEFGRCILTAGVEGKHLDTITHTATAAWDVLRRQADVVHIHSPGPALWSWLPALAGLPIVFTVHAPDWRRAKWSLPAKVTIRGGLAMGMRFANAVTAVSRNLADELSEEFSRPVVCVPNGTAEATPCPPDRIKQWSLRPGEYALHVGRIVPEKRLDVLLAAWPRAGAGTKIPLVVAGDFTESSYAKHCRRIAPAGVRFVGSQFAPALAELYSNAAMVIQPSGLEGASLVVLEAAAHGRCVIMADIPANRELLGDAGIYFPPDDISGLSEQIRRCYTTESLRDDLGSRARQRVAAEFSTARSAERMEEVYRSVLRRRGAEK